MDAAGGRARLAGFGCISVPKSRKRIEERAADICFGIEKVIEAHGPACMAIEEAFHGKNVQSALRIGEGRGFAIACAARKGLPVFEYSPATIKKSAVGTGGAHKTQVQEMMKRTFGLAEAPEPEHAADAMAIALCHCNRCTGVR